MNLFFRAQIDPVVLFDAPIQKKVTDRAADIEVLFSLINSLFIKHIHV